MRRTDLRLVGLLATGVALAGLWAASKASPRIAFPPSQLAEAIIRATPGDLATFFIELLGHWTTRLLTIGVIAGTLAAGSEALLLTSRREGARGEVFAALTLGVVALAVTVVTPMGGASLPVTAAVIVTAAAVYALVVRGLLDVLAGGDNADAARRRAVALGAGGAAGLVLSGGVLGYLVRRLAGPNTDVALTDNVSRAEIPDRGAFSSPPGLTKEVTSVADHYVVDIDIVAPLVEAEGWTLTVKGEVERPLELGFEELQRSFEVFEQYATLTCVSNEVGGDLIGHSLWTGVRLRDVLGRAGARSGAIDVVFRAADGYSDSIPIEVARDPTVMIAFAQNRKVLTQDHGFPCRVRVPPIFGMKNVKWLQEIDVVGSDYRGYWQERGWADDAPVKTQSRIDVAGEDFSARRGEETLIAGMAWAGARGISRVEVSTDGGRTWRDAVLREPIGPVSWQQWVYRWTPDELGSAVVMCRATDGHGNTQTEEVAPPHPSGATGYHSVLIEVA